jgi:3-oxoacyl-[acyl-carrier-protein] synthase-1
MVPLFVTGHGAVTALGLDAPRTIASLRSGLDGLIELPLAGVSEQDLRAVPVRGYAEGVTGAARLTALAARALNECLPALRSEESQMPTVFLGLPLARKGLDPDFSQKVSQGLARSVGLPPDAIRPVIGGRTSVFVAIDQAERWLQSGARACVVGAVDSLLDPAELLALSERGSLAEEYDGFFPGEAAAFLCLSRRRTTGPFGRAAAAVIGIGQAVEAADGSAQAPLIGVGLASALQSAVAAARLSEGQLGLYVNSVSGARAEFEDDAMARIRLMRRSPHTALEVWHPASYLGETGAAYGALAILWASAALELGIGPNAAVLVAGSEGQHRAGAVLQLAAGAPAPRAESPAVGLLEPTVHVVFPVQTTNHLPDDPGIRFRDHDDRHTRLVTDNLDALASLLLVRDGHLRSNSPWADIEPFERRILAHADGIAWSGAAAKQTLGRYLEGESEEAAAAALVMFQTTPGAEIADLLVKACELSPEHRGRIIGMAAVAPRQGAERFLHRLAEMQADHFQDVLWALTIARWLSPEWVETAARRMERATPDLTIALAVLPDPNACPKSIDKVMASGLLPGEASLAGLFLQTPKTWLARFRADEALELAPEALGLAHAQLNLPLIPALGALPPSRGAMLALGWSGESTGIPLLLKGLESEDEAIASEAASSLARLSGLHPLEDVRAEPDRTDSPSSPPSKISRLTRNRADWEKALDPLRQSWPAGRVRQGRAWGRESVLQMLVDPRTRVPERMVGLWEHALCTRRPPPVHARQWVATQRRLLGG